MVEIPKIEVHKHRNYFTKNKNHKTWIKPDLPRAAIWSMSLFFWTKSILWSKLRGVGWVLLVCVAKRLAGWLAGLCPTRVANNVRNLRFSQRRFWRFPSSGMWRHVAELLVPDASEAHSAFTTSAPKTIGTTIIHDVTICSLYKTLIFKANSSLRMPRNSPLFMKLERSSPRSQQPATCPYP